MKRASAAAAIALIALLGGSAEAHPGHGADSVTVDGDLFRFAPPVVTIGVGDVVIWYWEGSLFRNHSVTVDAGQVEQFDSDPAGPPDNSAHPVGDSFAHTFRSEGVFAYHCKTHPGMAGTIEVVGLGVGSQPRIAGLRVEPAKACATKRGCSSRRPVARFRLSAAADVVGRIERVGGGSQRVKSFTNGARRGANRLRVPVAGLRPGRYRLRLVAYDARDRRSRPATDGFRVVAG